MVAHPEHLQCSVAKQIPEYAVQSAVGSVVTPLPTLRLRPGEPTRKRQMSDVRHGTEDFSKLYYLDPVQAMRSHEVRGDGLSS